MLRGCDAIIDKFHCTKILFFCRNPYFLKHLTFLKCVNQKEIQHELPKGVHESDILKFHYELPDPDVEKSATV